MRSLQICILVTYLLTYWSADFNGKIMRRNDGDLVSGHLVATSGQRQTVGPHWTRCVQSRYALYTARYDVIVRPCRRLAD